MSKTNLALLIANVSLFFFALLGFASADEEMLMVSAMFTLALTAVNAIVLFRSRAKQPKVRAQRRAPEAIEEMDARTVLDLDARLEALERRERETDEAERIQQMVARGQQSAPPEPLAEGSAPENDRIRG